MIPLCQSTKEVQLSRIGLSPMAATENIIYNVKIKWFRSLVHITYPIIYKLCIIWRLAYEKFREHQTNSGNQEKFQIKNQNGCKSEVEVQLQIFPIKESLKHVSTMETLY